MFSNRLLALSLLLATGAAAHAQGTTTTLIATPAVANPGTAISLSAVVQGSAPVTALPQGTVTFLDGQQAIGTSSLSAANLVAPTLVPGAQIMGAVDSRAACLLSTADLNADGRMDVLSYCGAAFQVFLGDGKGHFNSLPAQTYAGKFFEPALLDVNGDGNIDIALPGTTTLTVLYGDGAGTFRAPTTLPAVSAQTISSYPDPISGVPYANVFTALASVDLDGDGHADLVAGELADTAPVSSSLSEVVTVFKNNGGGSFTRMASVVVGSTTAPGVFGMTSFTFADLNRDGKPDVIAAHDYGQQGSNWGLTSPFGPSGGNLSMLLNQGAAALSVTSSIAVTCGSSQGGNCTPCDTDGFLTLASPNSSTVCGPAITTGDFANRGKLDLVVSVNRLNVSVYPGVGDGTFGAPHLVPIVGVDPAYAGRVLTGYPSVVATDLDGDGKMDLLDSLGYAYLGGGDYTFTATANLLGYVPMIVNFSGNAVAQILMADFNSDGIADFYYQSAPLDAKPLFFLGSNAAAGVLSTKPAGGTHSITATYGGNGPFTGSTSPAVTVTIGKQTPSITGSYAPTPALATQPVTLSAMVTGPNVPATGTVTFTAGTTTLGTATLDGSGNASIAYTFLTAGSQTVTAAYSGDTNTALASVAINVTVAAYTAFSTQPTTGNTTLTTSLGGTAVSTIVVTSQNNYSGSVAFSCSGLPTGASCAFQPSTVLLMPNGSADTTMTISVSSTVSMLRGDSGGLVLAGVGLLCIAGASRRRRVVSNTLLALAVSATIIAVAGCSGGSSSSSTTSAAKSYTFNVTATSGTAQTTTAYTLNVQ